MTKLSKDYWLGKLSAYAELKDWNKEWHWPPNSISIESAKYVLENGFLPNDIKPRIDGGIDMESDGLLVVCTNNGSICYLDKERLSKAEF